MPTTLTDAARRAADAVADFDTKPCTSALDDLDIFGLRAMTRVLRNALPDDRSRSESDIASSLGVTPRHRWLLRRWLTELTAREWLSREPGGGYHALREKAAPVRADLGEVCADLGFSQELARFFERANKQLPALLRDRLLLQELLFPDGDFRTADAAYRTNPINRYLNVATREILTATIRELAQERSPVRILELGAGVGGTTADLVPALDNSPVDYHFTDVSSFFLTAARGQFAAYPWMRYGIVDLNTDLPNQPACDVIVAANVLHNAQHSGRTLRQLREVLNPGGFLIFVESCREHCQLLTSMHFLMSARPGGTQPGQDDVRAGTDRIFLLDSEWLDELAAAGLQPLPTLPEQTHPLTVLGQRLFIARRMP